MSVLVHAELVQLLAGNAVIAKTPSQGGAVCLTLAHALMARAGLPVTLLSGGGEELSEVLVRAPEIGAVAFVGGRSNGGKVAAALLDSDKRHFIEQEGLNAWGIWEFSQWDCSTGTCVRASSTASSAAPRTRVSSCSGSWSTPSSTSTCRW